MKISSNFHDYYDSGRALDNDDEPLYVRLTKEYVVSRNRRIGERLSEEEIGNNRQYISLARYFINFSQNIYDDWGHGRGYRRNYITNLPDWMNIRVIGFCGRVYPVISIGIGKETKHAYNPARARKLVQDYSPTNLFIDHQTIKQQKQAVLSAMDRPTNQFAQWQDFLNDPNRANIGDEPFRWFRSPILLYEIRDNARVIITNPNLKALDFVQVMTPPQAWQELSMYLGNNLAGLDRKEPKPISDELRAQTKGYDKWSFKNQKNRPVWTSKENATLDSKGFDDDPNLKKS